MVYEITGGADADRFVIDSHTGDLRFIAPPDHELPADADADNRYEIVVSVSDTRLTARQALSVVVANVDEAPTIVANSVQLSSGAATLVLRAVDGDTPASALGYAVSDMVGGRFEFVGKPGEPIVAFTQADVDAGAVRLVHDGSVAAPSYVLTLTDGVSTVTSSAPAVSFVVAPATTAPTPALPSRPAASPAAAATDAVVAVSDVAPPAPAVLRDTASSPRASEDASDPTKRIVIATEGQATTSPQEMMSSAIQQEFVLAGVTPPSSPSALTAGSRAALGSSVSSVEFKLPSEDSALLDATVRAQQLVSTALRDRDLGQEWDGVRDQAVAASSDRREASASILLISGSLSVGYVLWLGRGGALLASMLSALPAWSRLDPLPVLAQVRRRDDDREDLDATDAEHDRVERLFARARSWIDGRHAAGVPGPAHEATVHPFPPRFRPERARSSRCCRYPSRSD